MFSSGIEVDIEQEQNLKFISCNDFMKVFGRILGFWDGITMKLEGPDEEQTRLLMKSFVPLKLKKDNFRLFDASSSASFSSRRMPSLSFSRSQLHISFFYKGGTPVSFESASKRKRNTSSTRARFCVLIVRLLFQVTPEEGEQENTHTRAHTECA